MPWCGDRQEQQLWWALPLPGPSLGRAGICGNFSLASGDWPGLATHPTDSALEKSSPWLWGRQQLPDSQFLHPVGHFGVSETAEQHSSRQCFPRALGLPGPCASQPQTGGKVLQGEAGWGSALGKRLFLLSAASPSSVVEQQDPERCAPVTATSRDTLPRPGAVLEPRLGLGLGLRLPWPGPVSSPLQFGGPQHWHGAGGLRYPEVLLGIPRRKRELHLFLPARAAVSEEPPL